ncbi:MAG: beta-lactamase family protein [Myxococcales bacterium]|nr:beta-lactamase family protein [Myxococcales bacterium]MDH3482921.1 beta-lactamase family protein [Myxococcales bacterium]
MLKSFALPGYLLVAMVAALSLGCGPSTPAMSSDWPTSTPEEQGIDSEALADLVERIDLENLPVDSLLMARNGSLVLDAYFYPYLGDRSHDVASVTKSITSTLVGIAVDEGLLEIDQLIVSLFPDIDASKHEIELRHLLSMTSGLACGYAPGEQELFEMIGSENFVEYALDLPVAVAPGMTFAYCSPGSHLLSAMVAQVTGMSTLEFARERLFGPLGIVESIWPTDPQGVPRGWGDLQLHPRDMAKIGQLFLDGGEWNSTQIVSAEWVAQATRTVVAGGVDGTGYGYQWWILPGAFDGIYEARGRGGQAISVWPENELVVVFTGRGVDVRGDITPLLFAALKSAGAIEPNPDGNARLDAAIAQALKPPAARLIPELPTTADLMSSKLYRLDDNPFDTRCVLLRFDSASDVAFELTTTSGTFEMRVGMDGVPRFSDDSPTGIPVGLVGEWTSPNVFLLLYDEVAGPNHLRIEVSVGEGADSIDLEFRDPGGYFPTTTVQGTVVLSCDPA